MSVIIKMIGTPGSLWLNLPTIILITLQPRNPHFALFMEEIHNLTQLTSLKILLLESYRQKSNQYSKMSRENLKLPYVENQDPDQDDCQCATPRSTKSQPPPFENQPNNDQHAQITAHY
ncbi:hypothetical protein O181_039835 [Austropuccinia psidii MF-1]|uniref:Uncharacterized protein n=1 Tax=Austropuccinia psidii MF-1 TaxID=1389203 RepID=A0A9Q3DFL1_9BASI|nr:hypothetical protein [Austropuccinia psidii MF-1]